MPLPFILLLSLILGLQVKLILQPNDKIDSQIQNNYLYITKLPIYKL